MTPNSQAHRQVLFGLKMQSTPSPGGFSRDSKKIRGGMRAAQAVLKASKAAFEAEMAALSAAVAGRIQQNKIPGRPEFPGDTHRQVGSAWFQ